MRVAHGKGNDARKIMTYYRVNFALRTPYRVLCDGALLHHALSQKLYMRDALPALLGSPAQAVVTSCVIDELRSLGEATSGAALVARKLTRVPCAHGDGKVSAAECVVSVLTGGNPRRLLVASNDREVLNKVRREPGVPVLRVDGEGRFVLVPPGKTTKETVEAQEKEKVGVRRPDEVRALQKEKEELEKLREERRAARPSKKRKKAQGPNPLSVKKRKAQVANTPEKNDDDRSEVGGGKESGEDEEVKSSLAGPMPTKAKRVRKRKPKPAKPPTPPQAQEEKKGDADDMQQSVDVTDCTLKGGLVPQANEDISSEFKSGAECGVGDPGAVSEL